MKEIRESIWSITGWRHFALVAGLILIGTFMMAFHWRGLVRVAMCSKDVSEHCVREWMSASGGWIAVIFAYLTIKTMNRQTEEANRHQRENVELQILDKLMRAKRVVEQCRNGRSLCVMNRERLERTIYNGEAPTGLAPAGIAILIRGAINFEDIRSSNLTAPGMFLEAETWINEIESLDGSLRRALSEHNDLDINSIILRIYTNLGGIVMSLDSAKQNAEAFVERWETRAG